MKYLTNSGLSYFLNKIKAYIASQLNSKANSTHTHTKSDIIDLPNGYVVDSTLDGTSSNAIANSAVVDALDGKSNTGHTHTKSQITDFPSLATVATSGSYNDLSNKPTIPTVNNATLTIQKNGTTVKTFTANASSNVTCNITVPTKTSDLTNDSGFLTSHQDLSGYVPKAGGTVLNGRTFSRTVDNDFLAINGSSTDVNGAFLRLHGKDYSDTPYAGTIFIRAQDGTNASNLLLKPDGTANWAGKNLAMQEDVVPRSGGSVLTGVALCRTDDARFFELNGGSGWNHGAGISLRGKDCNTYSDAGCFHILASDGTYSKTLSGNPNGTLTWANKEIDTIEEQGNDYIRYTNGIQICWIHGKQSNSVYTWNFPKTFLLSPVVTATIDYPSNDYNKYQRCVELNDLTSTGVLLRAAIHLFGHNTYTDGYDYVNAIAIGRWK